LSPLPNRPFSRPRSFARSLTPLGGRHSFAKKPKRSLSDADSPRFTIPYTITLFLAGLREYVLIGGRHLAARHCDPVLTVCKSIESREPGVL